MSAPPETGPAAPAVPRIPGPPGSRPNLPGLRAAFPATREEAWPSLAGHWPYTRQLERVARGLYAAMCACYLWLFFAKSGLTDLTLPLLMAGLCVASAIATQYRSGLIPSVGCIGAAAALALFLPSETQLLLQGQWAFLLTWVVATVWPTRTLALSVAGFLALVVSARWLLYGPESGWGALDDAVAIIGIAVATAVIRHAGVHSMMAADRAHADAVRDDLRERIRSAEVHAASRAHQSLHDDALGVLSAIAVTATHDPDLSRRIALVADDLDGQPSDGASGDATPLVDVLAGLVAESRLAVALSTPPRPEDWPALDDVSVGVVRRAVSESLRNIERHAGVAAAEVAAACQDGWFKVTVSDTGCGFDPPRRGSWGRRHSIDEPMISIGGRATTTTAPGAGTAVVLEWPAAVTERRASGHLDRIYWATHAATSESIPVIVNGLLSLLLVHSYLALRYSWGRPLMAWQLLDAAVLVALTFVWVRRLRLGPPRPWPLAGASLAVGACVAVGLVLSGPGSLRYYDSFIVGMACIGLTANAFFVSARVTALMLAPSALVLVVATVTDPVIGWAESAGAHLAIAAPTVGASVVGAFLRRVTSRTAAESRRLAEVSGAAYRARAEQSARRQLTPFTRETVAPWLREVAEGRHPLGSDETRTRAAELGRQVRDELYLGGMLDAALRTRVAQARRTGCRVDFDPKDGTVLPEAVVVLRLLDRLLDDTTGVDAIRVAVPTSGNPTWSLAIVAVHPHDALVRLAGPLQTLAHTVSHDAFATTVLGTIGRMPDGGTIARRV